MSKPVGVLSLPLLLIFLSISACETKSPSTSVSAKSAASSLSAVKNDAHKVAETPNEGLSDPALLAPPPLAIAPIAGLGPTPIGSQGALKPARTGNSDDDEDPFCGDGDTDPRGGEECDDGNTEDGDGCDSTCQNEFCGDGTVNNSGTEQCDDGNFKFGDGCDNFCDPDSTCGNDLFELFGLGAFLEFGQESCVDGNTNDGDGCNSSCNLCGETPCVLPRFVLIKINSPASIAGFIPMAYFHDTIAGGPGSSGWGGTDFYANATSVTGDLEVVQALSGIPNQGCDTLSNDLTGKIAVVYRGICQFGTKALNAQNAGAIGVIVINNVPSLVFMAPGADGGSVTIPVIMTTAAAGALIQSQLDSGQTVNAFIGNECDGACIQGPASQLFGSDKVGNIFLFDPPGPNAWLWRHFEIK